MVRNKMIIEKAQENAKKMKISVEAALMADVLVCNWKILKELQKVQEKLK